MTTKTLDPIAALRKAVKADPFDLDARAVLADALEEQGGVNDAVFQRQLVAFCRFVEPVVNSRGAPGIRVRVGAVDGPVNTRVFIETLVGRNAQPGSGQRTVYAWVQGFLCDVAPAAMGEVRRGSWKKPDGPIRFYLTAGVEVWRRHVGPYGLNYLR